jgi:DNA-binding NarL/FixJ family response regulator
MVVRVLIVDRQPLFRRRLEELLPAVSDNGVRVVASTDLAASAAALVGRHQPDVALVDIALAAPGAAAAIAAMRRVQPGLPVLALTQRVTKPRSIVETLAAGAGGVLVRTNAPGGLATSLLAAAGAQPEPWSGTALTAEERRLWMLIAGGASTSQIARVLHVSERTVKRLTASLLRTLGVASRTEAAALAGRTGLLDEAQPDHVPPLPLQRRDSTRDSPIT